MARGGGVKKWEQHICTYYIYTKGYKGLHNWVSFSYTKELAIYPRNKIFPFLLIFFFFFFYLPLSVPLFNSPKPKNMQKPK